MNVRPIVEFTLYALLANQLGILKPPVRLKFKAGRGLFWSPF